MTAAQLLSRLSRAKSRDGDTPESVSTGFDANGVGVWKTHLIIVTATIIALFALFYRDIADMAAIWWNVSTYTHCLFIPPIIGWLVWQRRGEIAGFLPSIWWPGLLIIAAGALAWMLGEAGGIALFRHAALVMMVQGTVVTLLGKTLSRALAFPIFYLDFMIPVGEELVPMLQTFTAKMCMVLLDVVGVPAHIEGVFITTPSGYFEVAEACSGVKFLIAMFAYTALAANVCFKSAWRRAAFMAIGIIVPILANGLRAFGTIYISEKTGIEFAASFDHIIYGWFFFGFVMVLVIGAGWPFFDRKVDDPWLSAGFEAFPATSARPAWLGALAVTAIAAAAMVWQAGVASWGREPLPARITLPSPKGWTQVEPRYAYPWQPRFDGADHSLHGQFTNAAGQRVDLNIVAYGWQAEGRELVGYGQGAFDPASRWSWANATVAPTGGKADRIFAPGAEREVASYYYVDGQLTGSGTKVKLLTLKTKLLGGDQAAVAVLVSAEGSKAHPSRPAIDAFMRDLGPLDNLSTALIQTAKGR
jgi:exosortase A